MWRFEEFGSIDQLESNRGWAVSFRGVGGFIDFCYVEFVGFNFMHISEM